MSKSDGGPAFPRHHTSSEGMSLRDYFAIMLLASDARNLGHGWDGYMEQRAQVAYAYADAMLRERAK